MDACGRTPNFQHSTLEPLFFCFLHLHTYCLRALELKR